MLTPKSGYIVSKNPKKTNLCSFDLIHEQKQRNNEVRVKPLHTQSNEFCCDPLLTYNENNISHNLYFRNQNRQGISCLSQPQKIISKIYTQKLNYQFLNPKRNIFNQMKMDTAGRYVFLNCYTHILIFQIVQRGDLKKIGKIEFDQILDKSFEIACFELMKDSNISSLVILVTKSDIWQNNGLIYSFEFDKEKFENSKNPKYQSMKEGEEFLSLEKRRTNQTHKTNLTQKTDNSEKIRQENLKIRLEEYILEDDKIDRNLSNEVENGLKSRNLLYQELQQHRFQLHEQTEYQIQSQPHEIIGETKMYGRYFIVSTVCEETSQIQKHFKESKNMRKQHELVLYKVFSNNKIMFMHRVELQKDLSFTNKQLPTCYSHFNLDLYLNGCPILVCFEGFYPLTSDRKVFNDFIDSGEQNVKKMALDVYAIYDSKVFFKKRIQRFSQGGVYGSDYFDSQDSGEAAIWSIDASGVINQIKVEQKV